MWFSDKLTRTRSECCWRVVGWRVLKPNKNQFGGNIIKINVTHYSKLPSLLALIIVAEMELTSAKPTDQPTFVLRGVCLIRSGCATPCSPNKFTLPRIKANKNRSFVLLLSFATHPIQLPSIVVVITPKTVYILYTSPLPRKGNGRLFNR